MQTVSVSEAKTRISRILRDVERGETIIVTRRGMPIARITAMRDEFADAAAAIDDWRRYRKEHNIRLHDGEGTDDAIAAMDDIHRLRREQRATLGGITMRQLIEEGRE